MKYRKSFLAVSKIVFLVAVALGIVASAVATYSYLFYYPNSLPTPFPYNRTAQFHELEFNITGVCNPPIFVIPWSVTLATSVGKITITEPPNSNIASECCEGTTSSAYSSIVFSVPNGAYSYVINPNNEFFTPSGNVTVNEQDLAIMLQQHIASCGSSVTTTTTSSTTTS